MSDDEELNDLMEAVEQPSPLYGSTVTPPSKDGTEDSLIRANLTQWTTGDERAFIPSSKTCVNLPPGFYNIKFSQNVGFYFGKTNVKTEGLLRFPQANSDKVVEEIQTFWERESLFKQFRLIYKRGILLYGPPGSGKSCTIQLVMKDVIDRGGIAVNFINARSFIEGMRLFRCIQPTTPVVVLMEDIDEILAQYGESEILNVLDGVELLDKMVFVATTNYPQELGPRIVNRPSRFDKRFKIGHPNEESRTIYLEHLFSDSPELRRKYPLEKWVEDSDGFSLAHLKELFVAVVILGDDYDAAIATLGSMKEKIPQGDEDVKAMGFTTAVGGLVKRSRK